MAKENGLVKTESANIEVPDYLKDQIGKQHGMENVDNTDIVIPRLGLCQALSPQKRKNDTLYIQGLEDGMLFNTVTRRIYGEKLKLIMLFFYKNRIKFNPIDEGGGIDCMSVNGVDGGRICPDGCAGCKYSRWGNGETDDEHGNDAPLCTLYHNYMCYIPEEHSPIAASFKVTGIKDSKQILAGIRLTRLPMYAKFYEVTVVEKQQGKNLWYEKLITPQGFVPPDLFKEMENNFKALQDAGVRVDTTGEADEAFGYGNNQERVSTEL